MNKDDKQNELETTENLVNGKNLIIPLNKSFFKGTLAVIVFAFILLWGATNSEKVFAVTDKIISLFSPFLVGLCIAFVINTVLCPIENLWDKLTHKDPKKKKAKRPICLILSTTITFGAVFAVIFMLIPEIIQTAKSLIDMLPGITSKVQEWWNFLIEWLAKYDIALPGINLDSAKIMNSISSVISNYGSSVINTTVSITTSIVTFIVNLVLACVFSLYLLAQKETIGSALKSLVTAIIPKKRTDGLFKVLSLANQSFSKFVVGQLLEAVIIGFLCYFGMLIFKMPNPAVISILVGFTALIPVFGAFIGTAVGAFLILITNPIKAVWFVVFILILQQIEGNLIYPKVVGKSVGLPGILVLIAVTIGGGAMGIVGMLFSVPVCSILYTLCKEFIEKRVKPYGKQSVYVITE